MDNLIVHHIFGRHNANWHSQNEGNILFLRCVENYMNDLLQIRGHVFLNEVYDSLGMKHTRHGAMSGWLYDPANFKTCISVYISLKVLAEVDGDLVFEINVNDIIYDKI